MKKTKLLMPILASTAIASTLAVTSCSVTFIEELEWDDNGYMRTGDLTYPKDTKVNFVINFSKWEEGDDLSGMVFALCIDTRATPPNDYSFDGESTNLYLNNEKLSEQKWEFAQGSNNKQIRLKNEVELKKTDTVKISTTIKVVENPTQSFALVAAKM